MRKTTINEGTPHKPKIDIKKREKHIKLLWIKGKTHMRKKKLKKIEKIFLNKGKTHKKKIS